MTINRWFAVLGFCNTIGNKRKVVLDLVKTILSRGTVLNPSREKDLSHQFTNVAWSTLLRAMLFGSIVLLLSSHVYAQINLSGASRLAITFDHTRVPNTDQTNFPVLISNILVAAQNANGYDIIFTSDAAGQNILDHEIEAYNGKEQVGSFWVRIPTLSHTSDTTIYMFYGIPSITTSQENKAGVWSNGYLSVYHFGNAGLADSASAGYTLAGSTSGSAGLIGGGATFNGNPGTYLYHDSVPAYPSGQSPVTLETWVRWVPGSSGGVDIIGYGENTANGSRAAIGSDGSSLFLEFENFGIASPQPTDGNWHQIVSVYDGGVLNTNSSQLYLDGIPLSPSSISGTPAITTTEFKVGGIPTVTSCCAFNGSVDEVRVSSVVRSADWVATEYANLSSPSTFYSIGNGGSGGQGNFTCSPSILYVGDNTTCSLGLPAGATGQVTFSLDGQPNTTAAPNALGLVEALVNLASASIASHTIAFSYPGDGVNPASSGSTTVTIEATGSVLPNESIVYQFSITKPDGTSGYAPNGNVVGYIDSVNGSWSQINYDGLNRLISAQVTPALSGTPATNLCWSYDSFGNRTSQIQSNQPISGDGTQCSPQSPTTTSGAYTFYTPSNQIDHTVDAPTGINLGAPVQYDPSGAGNVIADGLTGGNPRGYLYDAEGRVCAVQLPPAIVGTPNQIIRYLYDAEGNRIGKETTTEWSCNGSDPTKSTLTNEYVVDQSGQQVTEFDGNGNWMHTNAYAGGQLIATYDSPAPSEVALHYHLADWLGTQRMQVTSAGAVEQAWQSLPFGEFTPSNDQVALGATEHHFTGKERDTESGLDYFGARYYASSMGRWMSPDWSDKPEDVPYSDLANPQSLNLYSYVNNNPLSKADKDGHCAEDFCIIEGGVSAYFLGAAAVVGVAAVLHTPAGQRSLETFTSAAGASLTANFNAASQLAQNIFSSKNPEVSAATAGAKGAVETAEETNKQAEAVLGSGAATGAAAEKLGEHVADQVKGIAATKAAVATLAGAKGKDATQKALKEVNKQVDLLKGHAKDIAQQLNKIKKDQ